MVSDFRTFLYGLAVVVLVGGCLVAGFAATVGGGLGSRGVTSIFSPGIFLSSFIPCLVPAIALFILARWLSLRRK